MEKKQQKHTEKRVAQKHKSKVMQQQLTQCREYPFKLQVRVSSPRTNERAPTYVLSYQASLHPDIHTYTHIYVHIYIFQEMYLAEYKRFWQCCQDNKMFFLETSFRLPSHVVCSPYNCLEFHHKKYFNFFSIQIFSKLYTFSLMRWVVPHRNNRDQKSLWTKSVTGYFNHCQPVRLSTLKSRSVYPIWSKFVTSPIFTKLRLLRT